MSRRAPRGAERLDVFLNGVLAGTLTRASSGAVAFAYATSWLERARSMPISRSLPLQATPHSGALVSDYFENLLPDDPGVRERLAAIAGSATKQPFDILAAVGRDCVGALQFYPHGERPGPVTLPEGTPISDFDIAARLRRLRLQPLGVDPVADFRISLAGAQRKTALLFKDGAWQVPRGPTPTTHILKPAIGPVVDGPDLTLSVENEWLCARLARAFGLAVAETEIADFADLRVLVVERFDRHYSDDGRLFRLPQEDACQALGVGVHKKYEAEGGPGVAALLDLLNESDHRAADRRAFMKAQLVFWLLAAIDGHAKNFSFFIRPTGFVSTPLYDVLSAEPLVNKRTFPRQKLKLAMSVGTSRHYRVAEILPRHWRQTAREHGFAEIDALMEEVARAAPAAVESASRGLPKRFPASVAEPIFEGILARAKKLEAGCS